VAQDSGSSHFLDKRMRYVEIVALLMKMCNSILLLPLDRSTGFESRPGNYREIVDEQGLDQGHLHPLHRASENVASQP
jgi:hypothetical protein